MDQHDALLCNPAWADRAIDGSWYHISEYARKHGLPMPIPRMVRRGMTFREYGCGTFGCVYPTEDKNVVVKLTKDETELYVANLLRDMAGQIDASGIVKYHGAMQLQTRLGGRRLFLLWRENAQKVGKLERMAKPGSGLRVLTNRLEDLVWFGNGVKAAIGNHSIDQRETSVFLYNVVAAKAQAKQLMAGPYLDEILAPQTRSRPPRPYQWTQPYDDALDTAMNAHAYRSIAAQIAVEAGHGAAIGRTLVSLADLGVLLTDPHTGNLGEVVRGRSKEWVITDPGQIAVLNPALNQPFAVTTSSAVA